MKKGYFILVFALFIFNAVIVSAATVDNQFKDTVGFIYIVDPNGKKTPYGTGFFVGVKNQTEKDKDIYKVYFVTAKHVLKTADEKNWLAFVLLRLNKKDGTSQFVKIPIVTKGKKKTVYVHEDDSVDIAVIPGMPDQAVYEYKYIPDNFLATTNDLKKLKIGEGSDIFFTGLFTPYTGHERNYPICRFGRIALLTDEKINWDGKPSDLYLVETGAYGGNSGAPVFFFLGPDREPGKIFSGSIIKLAGVIKGHYLDTRPVKTLDLKKIDVAQSNMGIAAVIPAQKLHEILLGKELKKLRGF